VVRKPILNHRTQASMY